MSKNINSALIERAISLTELGWTQNAFARDRQGRPVSPRSWNAVSYCGYGALMRAAWDMSANENLCSMLMRRVSQHFSILELSRLNDSESMHVVVNEMRGRLAGL